MTPSNIHIVREDSLLSVHDDNENYFDSRNYEISPTTSAVPRVAAPATLNSTIFSSTMLSKDVLDEPADLSDYSFARHVVNASFNSDLQLAPSDDATIHEELVPEVPPKARNGSVVSLAPAKITVASTSAAASPKTRARVFPDTVASLPLSAHLELDGYDHAILKDTALRLHRQEFQSIRVEEYTQYLASPLPENEIIRDYYMDFFLWNKSLLNSLRTLCSKLYFKGESQEIDRILRSFAKSWLKQFPENILGSGIEEIHVASYSLILLNTGLHNNNSTRRMSKDEYTRNTILTLMALAAESGRARKFDIARKLTLERELLSYYEQLAHEALPLHTTASTRRGMRNSIISTITKHDEPRTGGFSSRRLSVTRRGGLAAASLFSTDETFSHFDESIIEEADENIDDFDENGDERLVGFARALKSEPHLHAPASSGASGAGRGSDVPPGVRARASSSTIGRKPSGAMGGLANADNFDASFQILQDEFDTHLDLQGAPYMKEGLLRYRASDVGGAGAHRSFFGVLRSSLARDRWEENLVIVSMGVLRIYSFNKSLVKKRDAQAKPRTPAHSRTGVSSRRSFMLTRSVDTNQSYATATGAPSAEVVGDGNWMKNAVKIGDYNLCSGYAAIVRNIPVKRNECYWAIQIPRPGATPASSKEAVGTSAVALMGDHVTTITFCAGTKEVAQEYVDTCNFWAARITAIPIEQPITSLEYGWGARVTSSLKIARWAYAPGGVYLSRDQIFPQLAAMIDFFHHLEARVHAHVACKSTVMASDVKKRVGSKTHRLILDNWQNQMTMLQYDHLRYKTYLQILIVGAKSRLLLMEATPDLLEHEPSATDIDAIDDDYVPPFDVARLREQIAETEAYLGARADMKKSKGSLELWKVLDKDITPLSGMVDVKEEQRVN
ncbi:hypothetical protein BABINDRAFT_167808 [Babjeviella inositovora NRRL Y-12698]|uniref:SEC7 domain-containing protein n=1 Tax=Babjeviella inositovora NRRL Y-12698 TaxID=984486 RepID=A0A1E3QNS2_9ASCO|nr:uncharacterized protein BABINDRAFT_167808 [Babjeviella inositovora NRRL Y-12698]ODQ79288.1 hypothetical protein BABINDRAFT_167808 [Babjeviella inositovora NRRL Y-12698]